MDCPDCHTYEAAVMARAPATDVPAPCDHYQMSPTFQDWLVACMRSEVLGEVQAQGLDRVGIIKGTK